MTIASSSGYAGDVELVRLRGTARRNGEGKGPLAGSCELAVRQKKQRHSVDGMFELVDGDGNKTVVELPGSVVLVDDERRAVYSKIALAIHGFTVGA